MLGAIFVVIVVFMPEGLVPGTIRFTRWIAAHRRAIRSRRRRRAYFTVDLVTVPPKLLRTVMLRGSSSHGRCMEASSAEVTESRGETDKIAFGFVLVASIFRMPACRSAVIGPGPTDAPSPACRETGLVAASSVAAGQRGEVDRLDDIPHLVG